MRSSDVLVEKAKFLLLKSMPVLNEEYSPKQIFFHLYNFQILYLSTSKLIKFVHLILKKKYGAIKSKLPLKNAFFKLKFKAIANVANICHQS